MFKKILVPLDGSRTSRLGLEEAIQLAKGQNATLYLLHVLDQQAMIQEPAVSSGVFIDDFMRQLREAAKAILAQAEAVVKKGHVRAKSIMVENFSGQTADVIVNQAKKLKVDLIVLGTHGRRGIKRLVMGSDAEGVLRETPVPVMLVRGSAPSVRAKTKKGKVKKTQARSVLRHLQS